MQQDTKDRFEQLDKRLDDTKSYLSLGGSILTVIFVVISIMFTWNLQSDRANLRDLAKDIKEEVKTSLGKLEEPPKIEIYDLGQKPLSGKSVVASFDDQRDEKKTYQKSDEKLRLSFRCIFKNESTGSSGPVAIKLYTKEPFQFEQISTDEPDFQYEYFVAPEDLTPHEMPGGLSIEMFMDFDLETKSIPTKGTYPALLKVFYGKGRITRTPFNMIVEDESK